MKFRELVFCNFKKPDSEQFTFQNNYQKRILCIEKAGGNNMHCTGE